MREWHRGMCARLDNGEDLVTILVHVHPPSLVARLAVVAPATLREVFASSPLRHHDVVSDALVWVIKGAVAKGLFDLRAEETQM